MKKLFALTIFMKVKDGKRKPLYGYELEMNQMVIFEGTEAERCSGKKGYKLIIKQMVHQKIGAPGTDNKSKIDDEVIGSYRIAANQFYW
jgi:hypothetical protein